MLFDDLRFLWKSHNLRKYGLKSYREKVIKGAKPTKEAVRGEALREWEKMGYYWYLYELGAKLKSCCACLCWEAYQAR